MQDDHGPVLGRELAQGPVQLIAKVRVGEHVVRAGVNSSMLISRTPVRLTRRASVRQNRTTSR